MIDKAIARGDFDDYSYIEAVNYFAKGNVRDCCLEVGLTHNIRGWRLQSHFKNGRSHPVEAQEILLATLRFLSPDYGILYDLTLREGPFWFASGGASSGMSDALARRSSEFRQEHLFGKKFTDGFFRDVFRWNYLSQAHLNKALEGKRFQDWIEEPLKRNGLFSRPRMRGTLALLDNGCATWELTPAEIAEVRPHMLAAGMLMVKN
jgi:hypothetical protein